MRDTVFVGIGPEGRRGWVEWILLLGRFTMRKVSETQRLGAPREDQVGAEEVHSESRESSTYEKE